jgi:hypothetical protein
MWQLALFHQVYCKDSWKSNHNKGCHLLPSLCGWPFALPGIVGDASQQCLLNRWIGFFYLPTGLACMIVSDI